MNEMINRHPLLFTLQDAVAGCGFLAGITVNGKALMQNEDGKWWMYGVCPGAIAESGTTPDEAFLRFRKRYKEVLFDIAEDCEDFSGFKKQVEDFFNAIDDEEQGLWNRALEIVRANNSSIPKQFKELPRKDANTHILGIEVERLESNHRQFKPADNVQDTLSKAA